MLNFFQDLFTFCSVKEGKGGEGEGESSTDSPLSTEPSKGQDQSHKPR